MEQTEAAALWKEYTRTQNPRLRERLIQNYAVLARRAVDRLQISPWGCVSKDDLLGHAAIGLIDAVDRYDPAQGTPFEGFAMPRIRGAVLDAMRRLDWMPRTARGVSNKLRDAYARLEGALGRPARDEEVAAEMGVSLEELERMESDVARGSVLSLDDLVAGMEDSATLGEVTVDNRAPDPYQNEEKRDARKRLKAAIDDLPEREKLVVSLYYFHELTLREIGKVLNVTEQRVSQLHAKAMLRLSHKLIRHGDLVGTLAA